jgi:hypothetical protein
MCDNDSEKSGKWERRGHGRMIPCLREEGRQADGAAVLGREVAGPAGRSGPPAGSVRN